MKPAMPFIVAIIIFTGFGTALYGISQSEQTKTAEVWSAFIYNNGFNSGRYQKEDGFQSFKQCKAYAESAESNPNGANWECGLNCGFDSRRQGFQCDTMMHK